MQREHVALAVKTNHHRVVPDRRKRKGQVLQHHHRVAGGDLAQQAFDARRQRVGRQPVAAGGSQHVGL